MTHTDEATATRTPDRPRDSGQPVGRVLAAALLLVGAIIINLTQFRGIDQATVDFFDAVHRYPTADIMDLGYRECDYCRDRYGLHLALQVVAPGSRVVVPASSPYAANRFLAEEFTLRLYSFGRAGRVDWVDYREDPRLLSPGGLDPSRFVIATGPGGSKGAPWLLAVQTPPAGLPVPADSDRFLAQALRDGQLDNDRPPREFVILEWPVPRPDSRYAYQDLVLETSLLPVEVRAVLTR